MIFLVIPKRKDIEQYENIKKHCDYGAQIVMPFSYISYLIYCHHENWDGSGYLEGISGEKIPIGSRIIRVIDSFNAITHERPYKKSFSKEHAVDELNKGNGTKYDPEVLDAFLKILNTNCREFSSPLLASQIAEANPAQHVTTLLAQDILPKPVVYRHQSSRVFP